MAKLYTHTATVTVPAGVHFPLDMLRYDACWPRREQDAAAMGQTIASSCQPSEPVRVEIIKRTTARAISAAWTLARWQSFGVRIQPDGAMDVA